MTHEELRGLIPILALDSLPPNEEAELIAHLKICRDCSEILASHQQTAGSLGLWVPPIQPRPELRDRILRTVAQTPQLTPGNVAVLRPKRSVGRIGMRLAAVTSIAAALAFGGFAAQQFNAKNGQIEQQSQYLAEQRRFLDLASADSAIALPLTPTKSYSEVQGNVVLSDETDEAAVLLTGLSDPGDQVYTLWMTPYKGRPQNVADFVPDASGLAVINLGASVDDRVTLAVTLESKPNGTRPLGDVVGSAYRTPAQATFANLPA